MIFFCNVYVGLKRFWSWIGCGLRFFKEFKNIFVLDGFKVKCGWFIILNDDGKG